jgi:hypothetical protein
MRLLSDEELAALSPAEDHTFAGPIPTRIVASEEFMPIPQTTAQREVEAREIPEDMLRRHGYAPLGAADGPVKSAILGGNAARIHDFDASTNAWMSDRLTARKAHYLADGPGRSNLRYGYVHKS